MCDSCYLLTIVQVRRIVPVLCLVMHHNRTNCGQGVLIKLHVALSSALHILE